MTFTVRISTGNAAFLRSQQEVVRILRDIADRLENGHEPIVMDINGNTVGKAGYDSN